MTLALTAAPRILCESQDLFAKFTQFGVNPPNCGLGLECEDINEAA